MEFREFKWNVSKRGDSLLVVAFEGNGGLQWVPRWDEVKSLIRHSLATELVNEARRGGSGQELYEFRRFFQEMAEVALAMEWALPAGPEPGARAKP